MLFPLEAWKSHSGTAELLVGARALSHADKHRFEFNLSDLLDKSIQCKKNWLLNVLAAKQRFERQQVNCDGICNLSTANSKLIKWMTTGRASQHAPSTLSLPMPHPFGPVLVLCHPGPKTLFFS